MNDITIEALDWNTFTFFYETPFIFKYKTIIVCWRPVQGKEMQGGYWTPEKVLSPSSWKKNNKIIWKSQWVAIAWTEQRNAFHYNKLAG